MYSTGLKWTMRVIPCRGCNVVDPLFSFLFSLFVPFLPLNTIHYYLILHTRLLHVLVPLVLPQEPSIVGVRYKKDNVDNS